MRFLRSAFEKEFGYPNFISSQVLAPILQVFIFGEKPLLARLLIENLRQSFSLHPSDLVYIPPLIYLIIAIAQGVNEYRSERSTSATPIDDQPELLLDSARRNS